MSKVFIKLNPRPSAQNRKDFYVDKRGKRPQAKAKGIGKNGQGIFRFVVSDRGRGMLNTGFEKKIDNPWYENPDKLPSLWNDGTFHKKNKISMQEYFEVKLNRKPGDLTSLKKKLFSSEPTPWIQDFYRDFYDTTILDTEDPMDELTLWLLRQSHPDKCANSFEERTPFTRIYISLVNEDAQRKAAKTERLETAISKLVELKTNYTEDDIRKVAVVLNLVKGDVPSVKIKNALSDFIMNKSDKQLDNADTFAEMFDSLSDSKGREKFEAEYLLQELINNRIVSDYKSKYTWNSKKGTNLELIGKSKQEAIATLMDVDWRNYREELTEELKNKVNDDRLMAL